MRMNERQSGTLAVLAAAVLYGFIPVTATAAFAAGGNAFSVSCLRFAAAFVIAGLIGAARPSVSLKIEKADVPALLFLGVMYGVTPLLVFMSYEGIDTGMATTLHFCNPALVIVLAALFFREKISARQIVAAILCFAGVAMLSSPGGAGDLKCTLLAVASGLTYAAYVVCLGHSRAAHIPAFTLTFWMMLVAALILGAGGLLLGELSFAMKPQGYLAILVIVLLMTILPITLFQVGTGRIGGVKAALIGTLEPVVAVVAGIVILGETIDLWIAVGMLLIIFSVIMISLSSESK